MSWILGYGCTTAAGSGSEALFASLLAGRDHRSWLDSSQWPAQELVKTPARFQAFCWPSIGSPPTQRLKLLNQLVYAWNESYDSLSIQTRNRLLSGQGVGVILASTKSFVDDFIWSASSLESEAQLEVDALRPLLSDFLSATGIQAARSTSVSNACASSLSAIALAEVWLMQNDINDVIVVAADAVGPFVVRGFETLKVLTTDLIRSFSETRSGFHLGEAAAAIVLSKNKEDTSSVFLRGVGIDAEGFAVTRPSQSGESLKRACLAIGDLVELPPDLIVAHGTGTQVNDQIEDRVYYEIFGEGRDTPFVTGAKWCVGHTLGACGAIDMIAALEVLKQQRVFHLANTEARANQFKCRYLTSNTSKSTMEHGAPIRRVLVSSLGFGGIHASALVELK